MSYERLRIPALAAKIVRKKFSPSRPEVARDDSDFKVAVGYLTEHPVSHTDSKSIDAYTLICNEALERSDPVFLQEHLITITKVLMRAGHEDDIKALLSKIEDCTQSDNPKLKAAAISSIPLFFKIKNSVRESEVIERSVRARKLMIEALTSFGFEPRNLINAWVNSYSNGPSEISEIPPHEQPVAFRNDLAEIFQKNIQTMAELERDNKGACKILYEEFGILNFGRYPRNILSEQYLERNDNKPYGIAIYAQDDHNGAFYSDRSHGMFFNLNKMLKLEGYALRIAEVNSKTQMFSRLLAFNRRYREDKISFGILGAHGTKKGIFFRSAHRLDDFRTGLFLDVFDPGYIDVVPTEVKNDRQLNPDLMIEDLEGGIATKVIGRCFEPGATVILFSCSTGAPAEVKKVQTVSAEENERAWREQDKANERLIKEGKSPRPPKFRYFTREVLMPSVAEQMAMTAPIEFTVIAPEERASVGPVDVARNGNKLNFAVTYESPRANNLRCVGGNLRWDEIIYDRIKAATYRSNKR